MPASIKSRFGKIKTVLGFAIKRGIDPAQIRAALNVCAVLTAPKGANIYDPHPIALEHYRRLLDASVGPDRAVLVLAMNACMYAAEVLDTQWTALEPDRGLLVTRRGETTMARAAVLWPQTMGAIQQLNPS